MKRVLKGIGACPGIVEAKAKLVKNVRKNVDLKGNYILVVPYTTPLLTLTIANAAGIITDIGGKTCHTAVVAREFGIPCVVGTNQGTKKLRNGQKVVLDGSKGEVYEKK